MVFLFLFLTSLLVLFCNAFRLGTQTPPRGWNSWDSYTWIINETQVLNNAEAMVQYLLPFGYEYLVIDGGWMSNINNKSDVAFDEYGRLQPDKQRFPHGFKWLSGKIHSMGLKFGIHTRRGIHLNVVAANLSIYGTNNTIFTSQIVDPDNPGYCSKGNPEGTPWQSVDISRNGGQQYYNSLYENYCNEWNIDFIKFDCVFGRKLVPIQIEAAYNAEMYECKTNPPIYSLSPGNYSSPQHSGVYAIYNVSNMYRITGDTWDEWDEIIEHFNTSSEYAAAGLIGLNGTWPDLDMLPLGYIATKGSGAGPDHMANFTEPQQRVLMTLWSIAKSPLIFGGDMVMLKNDQFTLNLLTNKYALSVNYNSRNNKQVYAEYNKTSYKPIKSIWSAMGLLNNDYYVAMFNLMDNNKADLNISFNDLGINPSYSSCQYQSAWNDSQKGIIQNKIVTATVKPNDVVFYYLDQCK
eukprot:15249_1